MLREAAETLAGEIRKLGEEMGWSDLTVLVEDKGDVIYESQRAVAKVGVVAVVTIDRFARRANSGQLLTGTLTIDVTASEGVTVNRAKEPYVTAQQVAEAIAQRFHWRALGGRFESPLRLATLEKLYPSPKVTSVALSFLAEFQAAAVQQPEDNATTTE